MRDGGSRDDLARGAAVLRPAPKLRIIRAASEQREYALAKSEWSFKTAVELSAALAAKKGLGGRTGRGRHRPHRAARREDQCDLCSRLRARPRRRPRRRRRTGARREEAAARPADDGEGILQHRGPADDLGHSGAEGFYADRGRAADHPRQGRRRRDPRQEQRAARARRLAELQRDLRHHQQPVRSRPHAGRFLRRCVGGARGRLWPAVARLRYRRIAARAGVSLRRLCAQADIRPGGDARPHAAAVAAAAVQPRPQRDRPDGALRGRPFACCWT